MADVTPSPHMSPRRQSEAILSRIERMNTEWHHLRDARRRTGAWWKYARYIVFHARAIQRIANG
jgi:hypothetical protein